MRKVFMFLVLVFMASCGETPLTPDPDSESNPKAVYTLEQFNKAGTFDSATYELSSSGWNIVTKPLEEGVWVGLADTKNDGTQPEAGTKVMKLDYYDNSIQKSTHGFSMSTKVTIPTAGTYTVRFKYQGENFADDIKVAFDNDKKVIPTPDWKGESDGWRWNSANNLGSYGDFNNVNSSIVDFVLEAKDYIFTLSIDGTYAAGEWGFIDGIEIVEK